MIQLVRGRGRLVGKIFSRAFSSQAEWGWRLVVDLRGLTQYCKDFGFRYEALEVLSTTARKGIIFLARSTVWILSDRLHPAYRRFFTVELPDMTVFSCVPTHGVERIPLHLWKTMGFGYSTLATLA